MPRNSKTNNKNIRDNIFKITEALLLKHGIKGWNMDSVALEAGVSKNTLYEIISSKEQLIEDVVINRLRNNVETIAGIFRDESDFVKACEIATRHLAHTTYVYDLLILPQVFREYPSVKVKFDSISGKLSTSIHNYLNQAKKDGVVRKDVDNDIAISCITAIINHFLSGNIKGRKFEEQLYQAFSYIITGILA
ncbi:MAG: TetR/AcrR family transcriptional regulator [Chloroflexi bacterium]|nr:TetR/AcrR family transcriptional regulator [Chloroflexota bacterium]